MKLPLSIPRSTSSMQDVILAHEKTYVLCRIREWAQDPQGKCIFWLNSMADTMKSMMSRTVAQSFAEDGQLGIRFFFKEGKGRRGNATRFLLQLVVFSCVVSPPWCLTSEAKSTRKFLWDFRKVTWSYGSRSISFRLFLRPRKLPYKFRH